MRPEASAAAKADFSGVWGREPPDGYTQRAMAVPKQRQSHSRTHKRRSQHKITAPA